MSMLAHLIVVMSVGQAAEAAKPDCVACHTDVTPGIVTDWKQSGHAGSDVACSICHGDAHNSAEDVANVRIRHPRPVRNATRSRSSSSSKANTRWPGNR